MILLCYIVGMGFRPMPNVESTLVRFVKGDASTYSMLTDHIEGYLQCKYRYPGVSLN